MSTKEAQQTRNFTPRSLQRLAAALLALCVLCLSNGAGRTLASAQEGTPRPDSPFTRTPLQQLIERERARLALFDVEERRDAVQRLGAMARPESSRAAAVALRDSSAIVRATAARAVLSLPATEAQALLRPLLQDKDEFVRRETAYALGAIKVRAAVGPLVIVLARDKSAAVRGAAAVALGQIGSREAVPALISVLANERAGDDVRREAARALGLIGDPSAVPALRAVLTARDPYLSQIAHDALRKLDPASAVRPT
ncbi:MAG TPA: HEAT repeat domain-containing protein [Pyrinomonadaceae bacterium]|jgi:HEAT repeat protein|nr:HEAT repeat domain-containing protein [Pyrinomonadaceae bacterium]